MIDFYLDFLSPYAYLAFQQLPRLAASLGHEVRYHAVDLNWLKQRANNTGPATRDMPLKLKYARTDLQRWARQYGVPLVPLVSYDSSRANKGIFFAEHQSDAQRYIEALWAETYGRGRDMSSDDVLASVAAGLGWDVSRFMQFVVSPDAARRLLESNERAHAAGVFGVPTMISAGEMWWGNDRLELMTSYLREANQAGQEQGRGQ